MRTTLVLWDANCVRVAYRTRSHGAARWPRHGGGVTLDDVGAAELVELNLSVRKVSPHDPATINQRRKVLQCADVHRVIGRQVVGDAVDGEGSASDANG